ncbi:hypothetical protein Tco_0491048 [Tanacetum coccineum]
MLGEEGAGVVAAKPDEQRRTVPPSHGEGPSHYTVALSNFYDLHHYIGRSESLARGRGGFYGELCVGGGILVGKTLRCLIFTNPTSGSASSGLNLNEEADEDVEETQEFRPMGHNRAKAKKKAVGSSRGDLLHSLIGVYKARSDLSWLRPDVVANFLRRH